MARKKVTLDVQVLEDLSHTIKMLFDIVVKKKLTKAEVEKIKYVTKLMETVNVNLIKLNDELRSN
jgi:hypothetical protein